MSNVPVILISATRKTKDEFIKTPLGQSMQRIAASGLIVPMVMYENDKGLPAVYNYIITETIRNSYVVFVHDDVWIDDAFMAENLQLALSQFDIVGVAGNTRLVPEASSWYVNEKSVRDVGYLSGGIGYSETPFGPFDYYGPTPAFVQLLDGVFIAARGQALLDSGVRFDERFDFHFYDLDFCRTANQAKLKVGTWPIAITHVSGGDGGFHSDKWKKSLALYREKWGIFVPL